jgi:hypothetical protein
MYIDGLKGSVFSKCKFEARCSYPLLPGNEDWPSIAAVLGFRYRVRARPMQL